MWKQKLTPKERELLKNYPIEELEVTILGSAKQVLLKGELLGYLMDNGVFNKTNK